MKVSLNPAVAVDVCKHCNSLIPNERRGEFCCNGCESVYGILTGAGLSEYYQLKEDGICFKAPKPIQISSKKFEFVTESNNVKFFLEGVHCSACLWLLERIPQVAPTFVQSCSLNLNTSVLNVQLTDSSHINEVAEIIHDWGYVPHLISETDNVEEKIEKENRKRLLDLGIAGAISGNVMLMSIPLYSGVSGFYETFFEVLSFLLAIPSLFYSGRSFFKNVYSGFKSKTFPIDAPILLALVVAFFYSTYSLIVGTHQLYFDSLTALIFLLLASRYYLSRLRQSSQMNLGALDFFQSKYLGKIGDLEFLKRNQKIEFDGIVRKGEGWCDYSQFTGESDPVHLQAGDPIYAGTVFLESSSDVWVEVQKVGNQTRLAQLLQKVSEVQSKRTHTELVSDRWSQRLLMLVTSIAVISMAYYIYAGMAAEGVKRILALLIVTCPCALALATPLVFTLAMKRLLKKGMLIKDPTSLDQMPEVKKVFFDKTGTLTEGRLQADLNLSSLNPDDQAALYSMVRLSRHPVSRAIERSFAVQKCLAKVVEWESFEEKMGQGLKAQFQETEYSLLRSQESVSGFTESSFSKNGIEVCRIVLRDRTREESASIVSSLQKRGYEVMILSGDHSKPVQNLASELKVNQSFSSMTPDAKAQLVSAAMMIGDGVNDSLALSQAQVSIAVQGGMEAAIQSSQVYSMKPGVSMVLPFVDTALLLRKTLRQNFMLSTSYNLIGAILSISGHMNPLIAAILMPASALTVFWSSMIRFKERA
jgi:Cu2+-exporting ATPase/Cu+-exporting ATPase